MNKILVALFFCQFLVGINSLAPISDLEAEQGEHNLLIFTLRWSKLKNGSQGIIAETQQKLALQPIYREKRYFSSLAKKSYMLRKPGLDMCYLCANFSLEFQG